jgi:hypothetical protein
MVGKTVAKSSVAALLQRLFQRATSKQAEFKPRLFG